jgi:hypothetical protein
VSTTGQTDPAGETWKFPQNSSYTGQAGVAHQSDRFKPGNPQIYQTGLPSSKLTQTRNISNTGQQRTHPNVHPSKNPTGVCTGQIGERHRSDRCRLGSWDEQHPRVYYPKSNSRSPESLHGFAQDFGDSRNTSWVVHSQDFVHQNLQIKRNPRNPAKNSSNPRTPNNLKSSPFAHGFGRGIKGKGTTKGSCIHPPSNPQVKGLENTP